jgi:hypothetical protein
VEIQKNGESAVWKPLPVTCKEKVTVDPAALNSKAYSRAVSTNPVNQIAYAKTYVNLQYIKSHSNWFQK